MSSSPELRAVCKRDGRLPHCTAARLAVTAHKHQSTLHVFDLANKIKESACMLVTPPIFCFVFPAMTCSTLCVFAWLLCSCGTGQTEQWVCTVYVTTKKHWSPTEADTSSNKACLKELLPHNLLRGRLVVMKTSDADWLVRCGQGFIIIVILTAVPQPCRVMKDVCFNHLPCLFIYKQW